MTGLPSNRHTMDPVVVVGGSYAGAQAARTLARDLPPGVKVILLEQRSHLAHLYVLPRFAVVSGYEHHAFIPYNKLFSTVRPKWADDEASDGGADERLEDRAEYIQARVTDISRDAISFVRTASHHRSQLQAQAPEDELDATDLVKMDPQYTAPATPPLSTSSLFSRLSHRLAGTDPPASISSSFPPSPDSIAQPINLSTSTESIPSLELQQRSERTETIKYSYLVYATGARLPHPLIKLPSRKREAGDWLRDNQRRIRRARKVLVVGAGALGIQFATDIKAYHPETQVTLVNSRPRFMPLYSEDVHRMIQEELDALGVVTIHGDRVADMAQLERERDEASLEFDERSDWSDGSKGDMGRMPIVRTRLTSGKVVESDLQILCTGQRYNHELISSKAPEALSKHGSLNVRPTLQIDARGWEHAFAIGDVANTKAIKAGHTGYYQAGVAAANVVRLIERSSEPLEEYKPTPPRIKITVGKHIAVQQMTDEKGQIVVSKLDDVQEDLQASLMWPLLGASVDDLHE